MINGNFQIKVTWIGPTLYPSINRSTKNIQKKKKNSIALNLITLLPVFSNKIILKIIPRH